jgi:hypothetical protein
LKRKEQTRGRCFVLLATIMSGSDEARLLQLLQAHGEQFLDGFESSPNDRPKRKRSIKKSTTELGSSKNLNDAMPAEESEPEYQEWFGCSVAQSGDTNNDNGNDNNNLKMCKNLSQKPDLYHL